MGGYERNRRAVAGDRDVVRRHPGGLQRPAAARGLGSVRGDRRQLASGGCPRWPTSACARMINGPEAFTPDNEFCLGETEVDGFFVAAGFCAHGIAGAGGIGKVMAEWIVAGEPGMDLWHMDVRRFGPAVPLAVVHAGAHPGELPDLLRHRLPRPGARGRPAAAHVAGLRWHASTARRSARSPAGSGSTTTSATPRAGDEALRPRGWAGRPGRRRSAPSTARRARRSALFDETSFAKLEVSGPDAAAFLEWVCDNQVAREVGDITYTQALNPRGGIECGLHRDPASRDDAFLRRDRHRVRHPRPGLAAQAGAARGGSTVRVDDVTGQLVTLRAVGTAQPRHPAAPLTAADLSDAAFPFMTAQEITRRRRAGAGAAGDVHRRARLGALRASAEYGARAVARALVRRAARTASSPAATARSRACGWRRATGSGAPT